MGQQFQNFIFGLMFLNLVKSEIPDDLQCRRNAENMAGACAIESDIGCESYAGNECKQELGLYDKHESPQLQFYDESLVYDPRMQLLCLKGLKVPSGNAIRGKEIQGLYLEVEVLTETSIHPDYFSANTIIFPGLVFSEPLKKGLFCADMKMPEEQVMGDGIYFVVKMVPLPPGRNRQGVIYMNKELKPFLKSKDIPRTNILIKNSHKWSEFKEKPQEKNCSKSGQADSNFGRRSSSETEEKRDNIWRLVTIGSFLFIVGCVTGRIITTIPCRGRFRSLCDIGMTQGEPSYEAPDETANGESAELRIKNIEIPEDHLTQKENAENSIALPIEVSTEKTDQKVGLSNVSKTEEV